MKADRELSRIRSGLAAMGLCLAGLVSAEEPLRVAIIAGADDADAAALVEAELTSQPGITLLDRSTLASVMSERELDLGAASGPLMGASAVLIIERARLGSEEWLVARAVAVNSTAVLGVLPVKPGDASLRGQWAKSAAEMVTRNRARLVMKRSDLVAISLLNFRAAYSEENLRALAENTVMPRLLAEHLSRFTGAAVLDRSSMAASRLEKSLKPVKETGFWQAGFIVDGQFHEKAGNLEAVLQIRGAKAGSAPREVTTVVKGLDHAALAAKAAEAVIGALAPGKAGALESVDPRQEAARFEREALWLWDIGLPREAADLAAASRELGSRTFAAQLIPVAAHWFGAWPNLTKISWDRPNGGLINYRYVDCWEKTDDSFLPGKESIFDMMPGRKGEFRPTREQIRALRTAIDEAANLVPPPSAEVDRNNLAIGKAVCETLWITAMVLDLEYLAPNADATRTAALRDLREGARRLVDIAKEFVTAREVNAATSAAVASTAERLAGMLAENLGESERRVLEGIYGVASLQEAVAGAIRAWNPQNTTGSRVHEWVLGKYVNQVLAPANGKPTIAPLLYDWQSRDRDAANKAASHLVAALISSKDMRVRLDGFVMAGRHDCTSPDATKRFTQFFREIEQISPAVAKAGRGGVVLGAYLRAADAIEFEHNWTKQELTAGTTTLADAWTRAVIAVLGNTDQGTIPAFNFAATFLKDRPGRERWTRPLFNAVMAHYARPEVKAALSKFTETTPEAVAKRLYHTLAEKAPVATLDPSPRVIAAPPQWPSNSDKQLALIGGATVHGDRADLTGIEHDLSVESEPVIIAVLRLPAMTLERTFRLPWTNGEIGSLFNMRQLSIAPSAHLTPDGKVLHLAFGKRFLKMDPSSGKLLREQVIEDLDRMQSSWCDGRWVGQVEHRTGGKGYWVVAADPETGKVEALADTLRNPPLHRWDVGATWTRAAPIFPVAPGKVCAVLNGREPVVFDLQNPRRAARLMSESHWLYHEARLGHPTREWQAGPWTAFFLAPGAPGNERSVCAVNRETGESRVLLSRGHSPADILGRAPKLSGFTQPSPGLEEPYGKQAWSGPQGLVAYDGTTLVYVSPFPDAQMRSRVFVWKEGTTAPAAFSLDFGQGKLLDRAKADEALKAGATRTQVLNIPPEANEMWLTKHGVLIHFSQRATTLRPDRHMGTSGFVLLPWDRLAGR